MTEISQSNDTLTLDIIKQHCVIEHNLDDSLLTHYQNASIEIIEKYLNRSILYRIFEATTEELTTDEILTLKVPYKPEALNIYYSSGEIEQTTKIYYDTGSQELAVLQYDENPIDNIEAFIQNKNTNNLLFFV